MRNQNELLNTKRSTSINILIKPTNDCNFNCQYCFDREARNKRLGCKLSHEDLLKLLDMSNEYAENVGWYWHGGELTLMGIDYFRDFQEEFFKRYATDYSQTFQSNGYLMHKNPEWLDFIKESEINLGLSFDLYAQEMRSSYKFDVLSKCCDLGVCSATISVINSSNIEHLEEMYENAKKLYGNKFSLSFNKCYETRSDEEYNLSNEDYITNIGKFFKYWIADYNSNAIAERHTISMIESLSGYVEESVCTHTDCRNLWLSVFSNGDIYPCDRELPNYYLGNLSEIDSLTDVLHGECYSKYVSDISVRHNIHCASCSYRNLLSCRCSSQHICSNNSGYANEPNTNICTKVIGAYNQGYSAIQILKIDTKVNKYLSETVHKNHLLLPYEIEHFLQSKHLHIDMTVDGDIIESSKLHETLQFKVFKLFNPTRKTRLPYDLKVSNRTELLESIYNLKEAELIEILRR